MQKHPGSLRASVCLTVLTLGEKTGIFLPPSMALLSQAIRRRKAGVRFPSEDHDPPGEEACSGFKKGHS